MSVTPAPATPEPSSPQTKVPLAGAALRGLRLSPWLGLVLALVAGAVVWAFIQKYHPVFQVAKEYDIPALGMPKEKWDAYHEQLVKVEKRNALLELGVYGSLLGLLLALGEGLSRRSLLAALLAVPLGIALGCAGGLAGALAGTVAHAPFDAIRGVRPELTDMVKSQACMLAPMGIAVGLALGILGGSVRTVAVAALAGLAAAVLAAFVYPVGVSFLLPNVPTDSLMPVDHAQRALWLWIGVFTALTGLLIPAVSRQRMAAKKA